MNAQDLFDQQHGKGRTKQENQIKQERKNVKTFRKGQREKGPYARKREKLKTPRKKN
jgi:hypothetical protein